MSERSPESHRLGPLFDRVLELAQVRLGMDIAWVSEFTEGRQVFRSVTGDHDRFGFSAGDGGNLEGSFCVRVIDGRLPNVVHDARTEPETSRLAVTADLDIGAYVGVPVRRRGGELYGMLCCVSHRPASALGDSDVAFLELLAQVVGEQLDDQAEIQREKDVVRRRVEQAISGDALSMVFQPIVGIATGSVIGCEALARFSGPPARPDIWFADAERAGLGPALELAAIERALASLPQLPAGVYLSVNASPSLLLSGLLMSSLGAVDAGRVVIEVTEHAAVDDYDTLLRAVGDLRAMGVRLAVDDAGAGFASLNHILRLRPDVIKLDISLTRGIDTDPVRRALAGALVGVAHDMGSTLVAEGVEGQGELDELKALGADAVQGYLLARPGPLPVQLGTPPKV